MNSLLLSYRTFVLSALTLTFAASAFAAEPRPSCTPYNASERPLEREYRVLTSKAELEANYKSYYDDDARLKGRAYWDPSQKSFVVPYGAGLAKVPVSFIKGLSEHFTMALKNRYADAVFYPDMGHVHMLANPKEWDAVKNLADSGIKMGKVLSLPSLKALYHTVEMLQIKEGDFARGKYPQDTWKLWRYFSRNLMGNFGPSNSVEVIWAGPEGLYNTVREVPGMIEVVTIYFSAGHSGCFTFDTAEGQKFFDFTFETIPYRQSSAREPSKARPKMPEVH